MMPNAMASLIGVIECKMLWIFVRVVILTQLVTLVLAEGRCEKPLCYVANELTARDRHTFKIDCNKADRYKPEQVLRYRCTSEVLLGELINGVEPHFLTIDMAPRKTTPSLDSSSKPGNSLLEWINWIEPKSSTTDITPRKIKPSLDSSAKPVSSPLSFEGLTEQYIFTFLTVNCGNGTITEIFIGTKVLDVGAFGYISYPLLGIQQMTFDLQPGSGKIFNLPPIADSSKDKLNQTLHTAVVIAANEEVVVYGHQRCIEGSYRGSAFSVKGVEDLGTDYWVITHQSKGVSQVGVVSTVNNTNIVINGMFFNKTLNLNKHETFSFGGYYHLTGTHITSDKPVFVLAGNSLDTTPNSDTGYEDSFYECFPPVRDWERYFSLVPFPKSSSPFTVKILSVHDHCKIRFDDITGNLTEVSLGKGKKLELQSSDNLTINSSKVILLAQFSQGEYGYPEGGNPSMLLTPPYSSATRNEFIFPVFGFFEVGRDERNYIDVWLPPGGQTSDILLDNETVA